MRGTERNRTSERQESRQRLVTAALDRFGRQGYEGSSTRSIANAAGVNLAAIPYYFGGKEGLYVAVAEHIADEIESRMGIAFQEAAEVAEHPSTSPEALRELILTLVERFADLLIGTKEAAHWARFIIREQMDPSPAFDILFNRVMGRGHKAVCGVVGRLLGLDPEAEETRLRVFAIIGQVLVFRAVRAAVLRRLDWEDYTPEHISEIKRVLRAHVGAILAKGDVP